MASATILLGTPKTKRPRKSPTLKNPKSSKPATVLALTATVAPKVAIKAPAGGFRTISVREKLIVAEIKANPNLTAREYGDRLGMIAPRINDCILFTREGRALAEQGLISLPCRNRPRWASYVVNKTALVKRKRECQFATIQLGRTKSIVGDNRAFVEDTSSILRRLATTTSPKALATMHEQICALVVASSKARAKAEAAARI